MKNTTDRFTNYSLKKKHIDTVNELNDYLGWDEYQESQNLNYK
jgi:hypothetical protein